jgi:hypothetical protein
MKLKFSYILLSFILTFLLNKDICAHNEYAWAKRLAIPLTFLFGNNTQQ